MLLTLRLFGLFLLYRSVHLICSPDTGIHLILKGQCISNGTYFKDTDLQIAGNHNGYIHCVLPNETLTGGQWLRPDGRPVNCTDGDGDQSEADKKDPFLCTDDSPNANITLYLTNDDWFSPTAGISSGLNKNIETEYKCCLPTVCSDPHTNIMTINVFERIYITDLYVDLPSDITVIPQYYTVHCIVTGEGTVNHYYNGKTDTELTRSYCDTQHDGYSCSVNSTTITTNYTYSSTRDHTVTVEWEAKKISSGVFTQSAHDGDHIHLCTANGSAIKPDFKGRNKAVTVRAPSSSPSTPTLVSKSLTSITINWTYPNISDVDGYVVNASSLNDYVIQQVNGSSVSQTTLNGLLPETTYNITVRAYQDILGPASDTVLFQTKDMIATSSSVTFLLDHYLVSSPKIISESRTSRYSILPASVYQTNSESYTFTSVRTEEKSRDLLLTIVGAAIGVLIPVIVITCILIIATIKRVSSRKQKTKAMEQMLSKSIVLTDQEVKNSEKVAPEEDEETKCSASGLYSTIDDARNLSQSHKKINLLELSKITDESNISLKSANFTLEETVLAKSTTPVYSVVKKPKKNTQAKENAVYMPTEETSTDKTTINHPVPVYATVNKQNRGKKALAQESTEHLIPFDELANHETVDVESTAAKTRTSDTSLLTTEELPSQISLPSHNMMCPSSDSTYESIKDIIRDPEHKYTQLVSRTHSTFDPKIPTVLPVSVDDLHSHITVFHDNSSKCEKEYAALYSGEDIQCSVGCGKANRQFNRFKNIVPYDHNRISLRSTANYTSGMEYINASYIHGYFQPKRYIAAQGPNDKTTDDFWHLVWQENVCVIAMLTNTVECGKVKCEQYWPLNGETRTYGLFCITLTEEKILPDCTIRKLSIKLDVPSIQSRSITQFHLTSWPDHDVPESASPLMKFHKLVMSAVDKQSGPLLVHCSAGVGRTGTFITVDIALEQAEKERKVDIAGIVTRLRQQRMKMVQNQAQYLFVHQAVLESTVCGNTGIECVRFFNELSKLKSFDSTKGKTEIQKQFELLDMVTFSKHVYNTALQNKDKNRIQQHLPNEKHKVILKDSTTTYINACFIPGYHEKKRFIIAQSPMENTAVDFWQMILNYKIPAIVMCCNQEEDCCFPYWYTDSTSESLGYHVWLQMTTNQGGYIQRKLKVQLQDKHSFSVTQFHITDWPDNGVVKNPKTVLQVIESIIEVQQESQGGPVVVHCSNTVGRSGVYCAISNVIEQCKNERELDVFQMVKAIRMNKQGIIQTPDQYCSIYEVLEVYLEECSTYDNFKC